MEELLKEIKEIKELIKEIIRPKFSHQFVVSSNKTVFNTAFNSPLELDNDKHYEIALVNLETYYSFPNIDKDNNLFEYSKDNGKTWIKILIPEGAYGLKALNSRIQSLIDPVLFKKNKASNTSQIGDFGITIEPDHETLKSIMTIKQGYKVSFLEKNTLANLLGFQNKIYESGTHESENIVNIMHINSILIHLNIINGSFMNGSRNPVIYSFFPNVSPGRKIVKEPHNLVFLPVNIKTIKDFYVKITDQNNQPLNLRGENVTIRFHLREI